MGNDNEDALHRHLKGTSESGFRPSGLNCLRLVCMLHRPFPVNVAEPKSVTFSLMSLGNGTALFSMELKNSNCVMSPMFFQENILSTLR